MLSFLWSPSAILSFGKGAELVLTYFVSIALVIYLKGVADVKPQRVVSVLALGLLFSVGFLLCANIVISGTPLHFTERMEWSGRPGRFYLGQAHPLETAELLLLVVMVLMLQSYQVLLRYAVIAVMIGLLVLTHGRNVMLITPIIMGTITA